ncbi:hypothetical protein ACYPKM_05100 [Pseudomonas aeruginosa]
MHTKNYRTQKHIEEQLNAAGLFIMAGRQRIFSRLIPDGEALVSVGTGVECTLSFNGAQLEIGNKQLVSGDFQHGFLFAKCTPA